MSIDTMIGVDLAKSVFQDHGASMNGEIRFQRKLSRQAFRTLMARHPAAVLSLDYSGCVNRHALRPTSAMTSFAGIAASSKMQNGTVRAHYRYPEG